MKFDLISSFCDEKFKNPKLKSEFSPCHPNTTVCKNKNGKPHCRNKSSPKGSPKGKGSPKRSPKGEGSPKRSPKGKGSPKGSPKGEGSPKRSPKGEGSPKGSLKTPLKKQESALMPSSPKFVGAGDFTSEKLKSSCISGRCKDILSEYYKENWRGKIPKQFKFKTFMSHSGKLYRCLRYMSEKLPENEDKEMFFDRKLIFRDKMINVSKDVFMDDLRRLLRTGHESRFFDTLRNKYGFEKNEELLLMDHIRRFLDAEEIRKFEQTWIRHKVWTLRSIYVNTSKEEETSSEAEDKKITLFVIMDWLFDPLIKNHFDKAKFPKEKFKSLFRFKIRQNDLTRLIVPISSKWNKTKNDGSETVIGHALLTYCDLQERLFAVIDPNGGSEPLSKEEFVKEDEVSIVSRLYSNNEMMLKELDWITYQIHALTLAMSLILDLEVLPGYVEVPRFHHTQVNFQSDDEEFIVHHDDSVYVFEKYDNILGIEYDNEEICGYCSYYAIFVTLNLFCIRPTMSRIQTHLVNLHNALFRNISPYSTNTKRLQKHVFKKVQHQVSFFMGILYIRSFVYDVILNIAEELAQKLSEEGPGDERKTLKYTKKLLEKFDRKSSDIVEVGFKDTTQKLINGTDEKTDLLDF